MRRKLKEHLDKLKEKEKKHISCDFDMKVFNLHKRKLSPQEAVGANKPTNKGKKPTSTTTTTTSSTPPPPPPGVNVFLLDFTGHTVTGTSWNYAGNIVCAPANLTAEQVDEIIANVTSEYAPYNVIVTTDEAVYLAAPATSRMRCIFTETWEWYGQAGGVAFVNSFSWGDNTPCFVFTSLLNYSTKKIKEAAPHELGHTLGLYHQSTCVDGVITSQYNYGDGVTAPIMGVGYYVPDGGTKWWVGPTPYGCNSIQDDHAMLSQKLGLK